MNNLLQAALTYAELGYAVFPCAPGRKQPLTQRGFLDATTDAAQIEAWWTQHPTANIAIPTAGLVVVDVDGPDNPWLADQPDRLHDLLSGAVTATPRGGKHYIFRAPEGSNIRCRAGQLAPRVDIRAEGGYILVPPSHVGGKPYQFAPGLELDRTCAELPDPPAWLMAELGADAPSSPTLARVAVGETDSNQIPSGQRNATLARLGGTMRRVGMSRVEISAALSRANQDRWNHTSQLLATLCELHRNPKRRARPFTADEFHPFLRTRRRGTPLTRELLRAQARRWFAEQARKEESDDGLHGQHEDR